MDRIDRYIFGLLIPTFCAALAGSMLLLMLERTIRVIDLVGENNGSVGYVFDIMKSLIPHYLGLAIPAALFVACFVAFRRLANTSELAAVSSIGRGLGRLTAPALFLAVILTLASSFVHSNLKPHGRYEYRTLKFLLANASISEALQSGTFAEFGDITFMVESGNSGGVGFGRVFVHQQRDDNSSRTITSKKAKLIEDQAKGTMALDLSEGLLLDQGSNAQRAVVVFKELKWPIDQKFLGTYKPRGWIEAELTLGELIAALRKTPKHLSEDRVESEFNARMARAFSCLFIPLLAIPLAIAGGRKRSIAPIAFGIICLLVYVQSLKFVEETADLGVIPPALSIWSVYGVMFVSSLLLFTRAWRSIEFSLNFQIPAFQFMIRRRRLTGQI